MKKYVIILSIFLSVNAFAGWLGDPVFTANGGTGQNSSASTGLAHVNAGVWSWSNVATGDIIALAVTNAKLANMAASSIKCNSTGGSAAASDCTVSQVNTLLGTVTSISVASANGITGTSSGGATPQLTIGTSITGLLKGNGTAISAATAGTDYQVPITAGDGTTSGATFTLGTSGVTAATYTNPTIVVDGKGRITSASNGSSGISPYFATIGSGGTYADINAAMADSAVLAGQKLLVLSNLTINTVQQITKAVEIDMMPSVTLTKGSATVCVQISAVGVRLEGGRIASCTTGISIDSGSNYTQIINTRFASNTTDITDSNGKTAVTGVINE